MAAVTTAPTDTALITGEDLYARGDIGPCELVNGAIVRRSPADVDHAGAAASIGVALHEFARSHRLGKVMLGGVGVYTGRSPDTVRAADVLYVCQERYGQRQQTNGFLDVVPDLIVEILSPNDRWSELTQKLREYFAIGVRLAWVVDPSTRTVFAYRSLTDVREFTEKDDLPGDEALPGFNVPVAHLFAD